MVTTPTDQHRPAILDKVSVNYGPEGRTVDCFCGDSVNRSIVPHFKSEHSSLWNEWTGLFVELRGKGYPLKKIMRLFKAGNGNLLFSWTVIERSILNGVEKNGLTYTPPPTKSVKRWEPESFTLERTTVWDFPRRGDWAVHSGHYRGNWPPQIPRNLILQHTKEGDLVVDGFVGGATTLIEAWLLGRKSIGFDVSSLAIQASNAKLMEMEELATDDDRVTLNSEYRPAVVMGSSLKLTDLLKKRDVAPGSVALVCAHPPYLDSISYTAGCEDDLGQLTEVTDFQKRIKVFGKEARKALSPGGVCAVLIGDVKKKGKTIPLAMKTLDALLSVGFDVENIVSKSQHRDRSSEFYLGATGGSLFIAHEYLFVLRKQGRRA